MKKTIIFLGCSELQIPAIKWAKDSGLLVILCDINSNSPGKEFADEFINIGGDNIEELAELAIQKSKEFDILSAYCGSDFGLRSVAKINKVLNLKCLPEEVVEASLNKAKTKEILINKKIATPKGIVLKEFDTFKNDIELPLVVKPLDGSGSRGVTYVRKFNDIQEAIKEARTVSCDILIEEAIIGDHIDVSGFYANEKFYPGGQLDRYFSPLPFRYPIYGLQPPKSVDQDKIYEILEQSCNALGINWGPVKADIINTKKGPFIIEVTPRFHGDVSTSFVCKKTYDLSPIQQWFDWLSNSKLPNREMFKSSKKVSGWAGIFASKVGTIKEIRGLKFLKEVPFFSDFLIRRNIGSSINSIRDNNALVGFVFATSHSYYDTERSLKEMIDKIEIIIEE